MIAFLSLRTEGSRRDRREEVRTCVNIGLNLGRTKRMAGTIDTGPVDLSLYSVHLLREDIHHRHVLGVRILPAERDSVVVNLTKDYDYDAVHIGDPPPLSGVEADGDALSHAGELEDHGGLAAHRLGDVHQILAGIEDSVIIVIRRRENT